MTSHKPTSRFFGRGGPWWFMVAVLLIVVCARLRLLDFPLERDEGEYAYIGQLILQGIPPYQLAYTMKFPGTHLSYAAFMAVFGQSPAGIHAGVLLMTLATALMLFWLGKKLLDEMAGVAAACSYALLDFDTSMLGQAGHATQFCAFFCTAGLCCRWLARQRETYPALVASGFLFGTAVLMKQHAVIIAAWAGLSFVVEKIGDAKNPIKARAAAVLVYGASMLSPLGLCSLWLCLAGVFKNFKFWTFDFARQYAGHVSWKAAWVNFHSNFTWAIVDGSLLWFLALVGLACLWLDGRWKSTRHWLLGFGIASALAVCPDFYFRPHYFLIVLPTVSLLAGATVSYLCVWWRRKMVSDPAKPALLPLWIFGSMVLVTVATNADVWFLMPKTVLVKRLYINDPLAESAVIAKYINAHSTANAKIAVLGSEPEIYFLAHRHSATGYLYYTFSQWENPGFAPLLKERMIAEIEANQPEFITFNDVDRQAVSTPDAQLSLFDWWDGYQTNYTRVGLVDMNPPNESIYAFGTNQIASLRKLHRGTLEVFQRNPPPAN